MSLKGLQGTLTQVSLRKHLGSEEEPPTAALGGDTTRFDLSNSSQENLAKAVKLVNENRSLIFLFASQPGGKYQNRINAALIPDILN